MEHLAIEESPKADFDELVDFIQGMYVENYTNVKLRITEDLFSDKHLKTGYGLAYFESLYSDGKVWIIRDNSEIVATVAAAKEGDYCTVRAFYVKKEYRGRGLGKSLFDIVERYAGGMSLKVTIVHYTKSVIDLYAHWGFKITQGKKVNYTWPNWPKEAQQNMWGVEMTRR
jgi:GNAT superfamily N-acetyltransferase